MTHSSEKTTRGRLWVVATPIGNLTDISQRALSVLEEVAVILAEDTRHSKRLLNNFGITTRLKSCHEHNEAAQIDWLCAQLDGGSDVALISDAGTPLISDPGFVLVRALRERGYVVTTVPGASAVIAALSIAGLPTDRFIFDGFLPARSGARKTRLETYLDETRTVVLFESAHRIQACARDMVDVFGADRRVVLARELTKKFETVLDGSASELLEILQTDPDQSRGEFVMLLSGVDETPVDNVELAATLRVLMAELPLKQATRLAAELSGEKKNDVYKLALSLQ